MTEFATGSVMGTPGRFFIAQCDPTTRSDAEDMRQRLTKGGLW